ncbi:hypothetical protein HID58_072964 [Brassica napus]|uniref:Uncharacterized protein n=1 Tax=Brassica napus TaxID=3708 RepID=A0ABQ7Z681_BRANA|nr:hypothetical protein HID58_072964 [Brassica napus]
MAQPQSGFPVLTLFIFIGWADQETQCMWQMASLMEACDIMHNQRDKIRQLKAVNNEFLCERNYVHEGSNASVTHRRMVFLRTCLILVFTSYSRKTMCGPVLLAYL